MAINAFDPSSKGTILEILHSERARFWDVIDDPRNWNVQTRCTEWEVRDMVGHLIDVTEGFLEAWARAQKGEPPVRPAGTRLMAESLNHRARELRSLSREKALARLKGGSERLLTLFERLTPSEWDHLIVGHPYLGPLPALFYPIFHVMDYAVHTWDMRWGLGEKTASLDERSAGLLVPFMLIVYSVTVEPESAAGADATYGIQVDGEHGGKWKARVKDGKFESEQTNDLGGVQAIFHYKSASDFVLSAFQREDLSQATGDPEVIMRMRSMYFTI